MSWAAALWAFLALAQGGDAGDDAIALADALVRKGSTKEAIKHLEAAVADAPADSQLLNRLGELHARAGDFQEAETALRKVLELTPENAKARATLANVLAESGDGFSMHRPEEFEAVRLMYEAHTRRKREMGEEVDTQPLPKPWTPWLDEEQHKEFQRKLAEDGPRLIRERKERERKFLLEKKQREADERRRAEAEAIARRLTASNRSTPAEGMGDGAGVATKPRIDPPSSPQGDMPKEEL